MEPIDLTFKSQGVSIPGLEDALGKLERMDALLGVFQRRSVVIDLKVNGGDGLIASVDAMKQLVGLMRAAGQGGAASALAGGQLNPGDAAKGMLGAVSAAKAELALVEQAIAAKMKTIAQLESTAKIGNPMEASQWRAKYATAQSELGGYHAKTSELNATISLLERARGMAEALKGVDFGSGMAQGVNAATAAEANLERQAEATTGAMGAQMQMAERKAKMMGELAAAVERTAKADVQQAEAAKQNAAANAQAAQAQASAGRASFRETGPDGLPGPLLRSRRRYVRNELDPSSYEQTYRTGDGRTRTVNQDGDEVRINDVIKANRDRLAALLGEYRQKAASANLGQKSELAQQLVLDLRKLHAGMGEAGQDEFGHKLLGMAGEYEGRARTWGGMPWLREQGAMDKLWQDQMEKSNRRDARVQAAATKDDVKLTSEKAKADAKKAEEDAAYWESVKANNRRMNAEGLAADHEREKSEAEKRAEADRIAKHNAGLEAEFTQFSGRERARMGKPEETIHEDGTRSVKRTAKVSNGIFGGDELLHFTERFDAAGNRLASTLRGTNNELTRASRGVTGLGESFARNLASVTQWSMAVGALYAGLGAVKEGYMGAIHTDREMAMLGSIYRGPAGEYKALTSDVLGIASQQGRTSEESMAAAMKFSHLGLTRGQTGQFTGLAMKAANISGIGGEEAAHAVASYAEAFGMDVAQASVALDQMNSIANQSNVTIKELMETMGRTGAVAKATGFSITEMASLLAGGAGKTGLPVTQFAQAMGMTLTNFADPERAKQLKLRFGVDTFNADGTAKNGPDLIRELHDRYVKMSPEAGQSMMTLGGGARNAQRMGAIFDAYDESVSKGIAAQRDLNSAENENLRILDTTQARLNGLASAWKAVWHEANQGGLKGATNGLLSGATGLLGAADRGFGYLGAGFSDIFGTPFRKLGWAANGMQGDSPKMDGLDRFLENEEAQNFLKDREKSIMADRMDWERAKGERQLSIAVAQRFRGAAENIGGMSPAEGEKLLGLLAGDLGGDDATVGRNRKDWLHTYDHGRGSGAIASLLAAKAAETSASAHGSQGKEVDALRALRSGYEASLTMLDSYDIDPAVKRMIASGWKRELSEIGVQHKGLADADEIQAQDSPGTATMRERVRYTLSGQEWLAGGMRSGASPYEQLAHARFALQRREGEASLLDRRAYGLGGTREAQALMDQSHAIRDQDRQTFDMLAGREAFAPGMEAAQQMHRAMGAYGVGLNTTRQIADSIAGARDQAGRLGGMNGIERQGAAEALINELYEKRNALLTRQATITHDIRQTQEEMAREASRNLVMANPENQLAAVGWQRELMARGGKAYSLGEFGALSQEGKQQILSMVPGLAPAETNRLGELNREKRDLDANGGSFREQISTLIESLKAQAGPAPQLGNVNVDINLGEPFRQHIAMMSEMMNAKFGAELGSMRAAFASFLAAMQFGQGAGADALIGAQQ